MSEVKSIEDIELIDYKPAKTKEEMVEYLANNKNVVYEQISKDDAQNILFKYNYINVITPYKHRFAKKDEKGEVIKKDDKHIYENPVDFSLYYNSYIEERSLYPIIYKNISTFESIFKAITAYMILNGKNKITNSHELYEFLENVEVRISLLNGYKCKRKENAIKNIRDIQENINNYHDVYCLFDRLSLGSLLSLYTGLDDKLKNDILIEMTKQKLNFNVCDYNQFIDKVFTLVAVRNCIMHNNSLEILIRFYDPKNKSPRTPSDRNKFIKMINDLSKEK